MAACGSSNFPRNPRATATASATAASATEASCTVTTARPVRSRAATSRARLVLPTPPGPSNVTSGSERHNRAIAASSASRPMRG